MKQETEFEESGWKEQNSSALNRQAYTLQLLNPAF